MKNMVQELLSAFSEAVHSFGHLHGRKVGLWKQRSPPLIGYADWLLSELAQVRLLIRLQA